MMAAIIKAIMLATNTAAAARSFIFPAFSLNPGDTRSTSSSMAVLIISSPKTSPIQISTTSHSKALISQYNPSDTAAAVDNK